MCMNGSCVVRRAKTQSQQSELQLRPNAQQVQYVDAGKIMTKSQPMQISAHNNQITRIINENDRYFTSQNRPAQLNEDENGEMRVVYSQQKGQGCVLQGTFSEAMSDYVIVRRSDAGQQMRRDSAMMPELSLNTVSEVQVSRDEALPAKETPKIVPLVQQEIQDSNTRPSHLVPNIDTQVIPTQARKPPRIPLIGATPIIRATVNPLNAHHLKPANSQVDLMPSITNLSDYRSAQADEGDLHRLQLSHKQSSQRIQQVEQDHGSIDEENDELLGDYIEKEPIDSLIHQPDPSPVSAHQEGEYAPEIATKALLITPEGQVRQSPQFQKPSSTGSKTKLYYQNQFQLYQFEKFLSQLLLRINNWSKKVYLYILAASRQR